MPEVKNNSNPSQRNISANPVDVKGDSFILFKITDVIRAVSLLIGAGFFCIILLIGLSIASHLTIQSGIWMVMSIAILMSVLISLLTYYVITQIHHFKQKISEQTLHSTSQTDILPLQTQQKLLDVLLALQKELQAKEKNKLDDHS